MSTVPIEKPSAGAEREALRRRGLRLNYVSIAYHVVEATLSLAAGILAGSVALVGFGIDSVIELVASGAAHWRLLADADHERRERVERLALRIVGWSFLALAAYVAIDAAKSLWLRERPERSVLGIAVLALAVIVMPILARAKRRIARGMRSGALRAEAGQTSVCAYLSAIALAGVTLNALAGWWWADPAAALAMVPLIVREGIEGVRGKSACADGCC